MTTIPTEAAEFVATDRTAAEIADRAIAELILKGKTFDRAAVEAAAATDLSNVTFTMTTMRDGRVMTFDRGFAVVTREGEEVARKAVTAEAMIMARVAYAVLAA